MGPIHQRSKRTLNLVIVFGLVGLVFPLAVFADLGDIAITGVVRDVTGSPLSYATISDGSKSVSTNLSGQYSIDEFAGSGFSLTASKAGYAPVTKSGTALPGTTIDFDLLFTLTSTVSPAFFNVVPQALTLEATSLAPADSTVTATFGGTTIPLNWISTDVGGTSLWRGNHTILTGTEPANLFETHPVMSLVTHLL